MKPHRNFPPPFFFPLPPIPTAATTDHPGIEARGERGKRDSRGIGFGRFDGFSPLDRSEAQATVQPRVVWDFGLSVCEFGVGSDVARSIRQTRMLRLFYAFALHRSSGAMGPGCKRGGRRREPLLVWYTQPSFLPSATDRRREGGRDISPILVLSLPPPFQAGIIPHCLNWLGEAGRKRKRRRRGEQLSPNKQRKKIFFQSA